MTQTKPLLAALLLLSTASLGACAARTPQIITVAGGAIDPSTQPGHMGVTGQATLEVSPDCADLTITIGAEDAKPGAAAKALDGKQRQLVAGLAATGASGTDVKMSNLELDPVYEQTLQGYTTTKISGYRAQLTITATTRDFGRIAAMLDAAATAGASAMATAFRRSDLPELKKQVRDMALKAAQAKAAQTAGTLGIKLGRITSVAENQGGQMWSQTYFPQVANTAQARDNSGGAPTMGGSMQPLTLDVTIEFELARA